MERTKEILERERTKVNESLSHFTRATFVSSILVPKQDRGRWRAISIAEERVGACRHYGIVDRSSDGYMTVSEIGSGVTTPKIIPSALTMPPGLAFAYTYANTSYTEPRNSFHLPDPIFPPMQFS